MRCANSLLVCVFTLSTVVSGVACVPVDSGAARSTPERDSDPAPEPPPDPIAPGVWSFDGVTAADDDDGDLDPLFDALSAPRVVALGESVHTSGGFYALKSRLVKVLVEHHGFRSFAWENPRTPSAIMDNFVQGGACDDATANRAWSAAFQAGFFGVFVSDDTWELFSWLCAFNRDHPDDRVRTWGFDMQFDVPADRATITAFINTHAAAQTALLDGLDRCVTNAVVTVADDDHAACLSTIDALGAVAAGVTAVDAEARALFDVALGSWRAWQQTLYFYDRDLASTYEARDLQMAENFLTLNGLYDGAAKVVVWAHNFHIAQDHDSVTSGFLAGVPSTGSVLKDVLGDDYAAVALVAGDTGINWPGVGTGPIGYGADPQSVEATLKAFDAPALIVRGDAPVLAGERTIGDMVLDVASNFAVVLYLASSPGMTTSY